MAKDVLEIATKIFDFLISSKFLFSISIFLIIVNSIKKNNNYFDIRKIFSDQIKIFDGSKGQLFLFYGVPVLLSFATVNIKHIDSNIVANIVIVLSVMISMIFAMIGTLVSFEKKESQRQVQSETFNTLSFEAILCITALLLSFIILFVGTITNEHISFTLSFIIYYLMYTIFLNIFIVIKRLKKLSDNR